MTLSRIIVDAYCYQCDHVFDKTNCRRIGPRLAAILHAKQTGHMVRINTHITEIHNQNGKQHGKQSN
jgi:hypothetical protein